MTRFSKHDCLEDLRLRILSLNIKPGTVLDESDLSAEYGLSRTPLREVFQRLAGEGYISLERNRGAKVASMDLAEMRVFFQTAPMVYASAARLAAECRTDEQLRDLKAIQDEFRAATQEGAENAALLNHRFHEKIGEMAHNDYLMPSLRRLLIDHTRLGQVFYRPASVAEKVLVGRAVDQHEAMIAAIKAREPAVAVDLTLQHWDLSRDRMERFVQPDPLPHDVIPLKEKRNAV